MSGTDGTEPGRADCYGHVREYALAAKARADRGGTQNYRDTHLIARLHLGLLDDAPVACAHCGVTDYHAALYAALNWPDIPVGRLRRGETGHMFSRAAETDYIPLCGPCHRRMDFPDRSGCPRRPRSRPPQADPEKLIAFGRARRPWNPDGVNTKYVSLPTDAHVIAYCRSRHWNPEA